jgi:transposase-like protein
VPRPPPASPPVAITHAVTEQTDRLRLQVAAAARRVGVAPSTLRTWDRRYGIGPTDHTAATPPTTWPASISCTAP